MSIVHCSVALFRAAIHSLPSLIPCRLNRFFTCINECLPIFSRRRRLGFRFVVSHSKFSWPLSPVSFWLENPWASWFFKQPCIRKLLLDFPDILFAYVDQCRFSTVWKKPTGFMTNELSLSGDWRKCTCRDLHFQLVGTAPGGRTWLSLAEVYPWPLCSWLVDHMSNGALWQRCRLGGHRR